MTPDDTQHPLRRLTFAAMPETAASVEGLAAGEAIDSLLARPGLRQSRRLQTSSCRSGRTRPFVSSGCHQGTIRSRGSPLSLLSERDVAVAMLRRGHLVAHMQAMRTEDWPSSCALGYCVLRDPSLVPFG